MAAQGFRRPVSYRSRRARLNDSRHQRVSVDHKREAVTVGIHCGIEGCSDVSSVLVPFPGPKFCERPQPGSPRPFREWIRTFGPSQGMSQSTVGAERDIGRKRCFLRRDRWFESGPSHRSGKEPWLPNVTPSYGDWRFSSLPPAAESVRSRSCCRGREPRLSARLCAVAWRPFGGARPHGAVRSRWWCGLRNISGPTSGELRARVKY
jgi:hypothetical protein